MNIYIETDQHEQCVNYRDQYYIKYIAPQLTEKKTTASSLVLEIASLSYLSIQGVPN